jgi:phenylpropionate dioxygenase-like ring-hydroxylating dioxygenase large terminal subunit
MLKNLWYVACFEDEIADGAPFAARMLGQDFALWRTADGSIACTSSVCIHRGGALARGKVNGGLIACPYHGWEFGADGRCRKIPSLGADVKIPARARVDAYPVQLRYGMVWVFLGDLPEAERPPVPDCFDAVYGAAGWRTIKGRFDYKANWQRVTENGLDTAHVHFVHPAFGNPDAAVVEDAPIREFPWGAASGHTFTSSERTQKGGALGEVLRESGAAPQGRRKPQSEIQFHMAGLTVMIYQKITPQISQVIFSCKTPVSPTETTTFWVQARNYKLEPEHDAERREGILAVYRQDAAIVEHLTPEFVPSGLADELSVVADRLPVRFRTMARDLARRGWEIDWHRLAGPNDGPARVIPCPARRDESGWVFDSVPMRPAGSS